MKERAYKYRFYPTPEQAELLAQTFGCVRVVYNKVLGWRTDAFNQDKKDRLFKSQCLPNQTQKRDGLRLVK